MVTESSGIVKISWGFYTFTPKNRVKSNDELGWDDGLEWDPMIQMCFYII